jgi:ATP-dependent DNA helicase RecQ
VAFTLGFASRPVLKGEERVEMRRVVARTPAPARPRTSTAEALTPVAAGVLQRLKAWRTGEARAQAVPAYVILHDSTLSEIARRQPSDAGALARIPGLGARKLERYGDALLQITRAP